MGVESSQYLNPTDFLQIVIVGPKNGDESFVELSNLPKDAKILATGMNIADLRRDCPLFTEGNVLLNVTGTSEVLNDIIAEMPFLVWIHSITAGKNIIVILVRIISYE